MWVLYKDFRVCRNRIIIDRTIINKPGDIRTRLVMKA